MLDSKARIDAMWKMLVTLHFVGLIFLLASVLNATLAQAQPPEGKNVEGQIIGGTAVPDDKYRFVAALLDKTHGSTPLQQQFCGGALIDEDSVLTAAHCARAEKAQNLNIVVGRTVLNSNQGQVRNVARINIHPAYNPATGANDVAVLKLDVPVVGLPTVRLPSAKQNGFEKPGRNLTVAGWGNTKAQPPDGSAGTRFPNRMREAQVPVVSDAIANQIYKTFVPKLMIAAGKTGKDACQGDSGGPMFERVNTAVGAVYYQVGVTSFGIGCGAPGYPGVYAEVNNPGIRKFITLWATR
jgi:secreted trypsin-like serine protease